MNDTPQPSGLLGSAVFDTILKALGPHPLYVLIFALIFMPLVLCIYAFTAVDSDSLKIATAGGFLVVVLVALLMLRSLEVGKQRRIGLQTQIDEGQTRAARLAAELEEQRALAEKRGLELEQRGGDSISLPHDAIRAHFLSAIKNTRVALVHDNATFVKEIENTVSSFEATSDDWPKGIISTDTASYERILCEFYSQAKRSVFATSNENYMAFWKSSDRSDKIIDAHKAAYEAHGAIVTRVFVFSAFRNISNEHIDVMEKQDELRFIRARALITDENQRIDVSPDILRDFAIIDGGESTQTIGIESSAGLSSVARWYFRGNRKLETTAKNMEFASIPLDKVKDRLAEDG